MRALLVDLVIQTLVHFAAVVPLEVKVQLTAINVKITLVHHGALGNIVEVHRINLMIAHLAALGSQKKVHLTDPGNPLIAHLIAPVIPTQAHLTSLNTQALCMIKVLHVIPVLDPFMIDPILETTVHMTPLLLNILVLPAIPVLSTSAVPFETPVLLSATPVLPRTPVLLPGTPVLLPRTPFLLSGKPVLSGTPVLHGTLVLR